MLISLLYFAAHSVTSRRPNWSQLVNNYLKFNIKRSRLRLWVEIKKAKGDSSSFLYNITWLMQKNGISNWIEWRNRFLTSNMQMQIKCLTPGWVTLHLLSMWISCIISTFLSYSLLVTENFRVSLCWLNLTETLVSAIENHKKMIC